MKKCITTAFTVSSFTFLTLLYADWQVPGFVSFVFPVYIPFIVAMVFGVWALFLPPVTPRVGRERWVIAGILGVMLATIFFREGEVFGVMKYLFAFAVLVFPVLLVKHLSVD